MKIEIDLNEILADEYGNNGENLAQSVMRQIIEHFTDDIGDQVNKAIRDLINEKVAEAAKTAVADYVKGVAEELLETGYSPVDQYGSKAQPTTLREQLHKTLVGQCNFSKCSSSYNNNAYTNAVLSAVDSKLVEFKKEFSNQVNGEFVKSAMNHAVSELKKKLQLN